MGSKSKSIARLNGHTDLSEFPRGSGSATPLKRPYSRRLGGMNRASPQMRDLASRLIEQETKGNTSSTARTPATFYACEKLRVHLATLMGNDGFRTLYSRALALAAAETVWLRAVHVKRDGSLGGVEQLSAQIASDEWSNGRIVLLALLLGLLGGFIGDDFMLGIVREVWPKARLDNLNFGKGAKS